MDPHDPSRLLLDQLCQVPHSTFSPRRALPLRFMLAYRTKLKCAAYCMWVQGATREYVSAGYTT